MRGRSHKHQSLSRRHVVRSLGSSLLLASASFAPHGARAQDDLRDVAVIFVGASWCPHCKKAAPVLAAVLQPVGVPVLVASHDARPILPFASAQDARSHPIASQIVALPTTLIYSRVADTVVAQIEGYGGAQRYATRVAVAVRQAAALSSTDGRRAFAGVSQ